MPARPRFEKSGRSARDQRAAERQRGAREPAAPADPLRAAPWRLTRRQHLVLGLVFLAALGLRVAHWSGQQRNNPFFSAPVMDEKMHHEWAQAIASGQGLGPRPFFRAPLYYYLLAGLYAVCGPNIALARLLGAVLGAVTCYLIARLGAGLAGFAVGLLAGLLAACYWPLIYFDAELLTVGLEIFLNVALLLVLLAAVRRGALPLFVLAGVLWGLSAVARPNILAFAPAILLWIWLGPRASVRPPRRALELGLVLAGAALMIMPVTIRNRLVGHEWVLIASNGGVNFYIGNNPLSDGIAAIVPGTRADWQGGYEDTHRIPELALGRKLSEGEVSQYWSRQARAWIKADPGAWLALTFKKFRLFWTPVEIPNNQPTWFFAKLSEISILYWLGFPVIAGLGLAALAVLRGWRLWLLPLLFLLIYTGTVVLFFCNDRYRLPAVPALILLAAYGVVRLAGLLRERRFVRLAAYAGIGVLAGAFLYSNPPERGRFRADSDGMGQHNLGVLYAGRAAADRAQHRDDRADAEKALLHLREAVRLRPVDAPMRMALGSVLLDQQRPDEARAELARAVEIAPQDAEGRVRYGNYLASVGRFAEAAKQFQQAVELNPARADAHRLLASVLAATGNEPGAIEHYRKALALRPELAEVHHELALLYARRPNASAADYAAAAAEFEAALRARPDYPAALLNLGSAQAKLGRYSEAEASYRRILARDPQHVVAAMSLAYVLRETHRPADAIAVLRQAVAATAAAPDPELLNALAWLLATTPDDSVRNGPEALRLAEQAGRRSAPDISIMNTLAAAFAEVGQFERAVAISQQALAAARRAGQPESVREIETRLKLYEQRQPYREEK